MNINDKAAYVKREAANDSLESNPRNHHCHWPGCRKQVPPAMWGCISHWRKLPQHLRNLIWVAYVPGQEITMTPNAEYLKVMAQVNDWISINGG